MRTDDLTPEPVEEKVNNDIGLSYAADVIFMTIGLMAAIGVAGFLLAFFLLQGLATRITSGLPI